MSSSSRTKTHAEIERGLEAGIYEALKDAKEALAKIRSIDRTLFKLQRASSILLGAGGLFSSIALGGGTANFARSAAEIQRQQVIFEKLSMQMNEVINPVVFFDKVNNNYVSPVLKTMQIREVKEFGTLTNKIERKFNAVKAEFDENPMKTFGKGLFIASLALTIFQIVYEKILQQMVIDKMRAEQVLRENKRREKLNETYDYRGSK